MKLPETSLVVASRCRRSEHRTFNMNFVLVVLIVKKKISDKETDENITWCYLNAQIIIELFRNFSTF